MLGVGVVGGPLSPPPNSIDPHIHLHAFKSQTQRGHKLAEHFYLRSDGTRAYYFSLEDLRRIFVEEVGGVGAGGWVGVVVMKGAA